jgi:glycosyltransferase involved in cell wall biosynthesis
VGSNLPDRSGWRESERKRLGAADETLVIAAFGTSHESRLPSYLVTAVNAVAQRHRSVIVLNLGADAPVLVALDPSVELIEPGSASAEAIADGLAASDLFLGAWIDGASTRRTTLMAALQHGLPVVATAGPLTDSVLRTADEALALVPIDRQDLFADAAHRLALDESTRLRMGRAARDLYRQRFDWPVTSRRLLDLVEAA